MSHDVTENTPSILCEMPEEVLSLILAQVPVKDLLNCCVCVCKLWNNIINSKFLWHKKCEHSNIPERVIHLSDDVRKLCLKNPFKRNLIKNSQADKELWGWCVTENGGDNFIIEENSPGAKPIKNYLPSRENVNCWATSYGLCEKYQMVDLLAEGCSAAVMDEIKPAIEISEWFAARFDCGSHYKLTVELMDENLKQLDTFGFEKTFQQWTAAEWEKASHTFVDYSAGVRFICYTHSGKDSEFWAGHYGPKFTLSSVQLHFH